MLVVGVVVGLLGLIMFIGNVTGMNPTLPYVGGITMAIGGAVYAAGNQVLQGESIFGAESLKLESERETSRLTVVLAILLFGPLTVILLFVHVGLLEKLFSKIAETGEFEIGSIASTVFGGALLWLVPGLPTFFGVRSLVQRARRKSAG